MSWSGSANAVLSAALSGIACPPLAGVFGGRLAACSPYSDQHPNAVALPHDRRGTRRVPWRRSPFRSIRSWPPLRRSNERGKAFGGLRAGTDGLWWPRVSEGPAGRNGAPRRSPCWVAVAQQVVRWWPAVPRATTGRSPELPVPVRLRRAGITARAAFFFPREKKKAARFLNKSPNDQSTT